MKFRNLLAIVALVFSSQAMAYTQDLGVLNSSGTDFYSKGFIRFFGLGSSLDPFTDYYSFNTGSASGATGGVLAFDFGFVDLQLNSVKLLAADGSFSPAASGSTPGDFTFANLLANTSYTLAVSGVLLSNRWLDLGAAYYEGSIRSVASAAPEPSGLLLAVAGLLGVVALARRRKAS